MKKQFLTFILAALIISCASTNSEQPDSSVGVPLIDSNNVLTVNFSEVEGKEWRLIEIHTDSEEIQISRNVPPGTFGDIFTISFLNGTVSGTGAPNRYSAPYTIGDDQGISVMVLLSTMMVSLFELSNLSEYEYFAHIQNSYKWGLVNNNLELYSRAENNREVKLVFAD